MHGRSINRHRPQGIKWQRAVFYNSIDGSLLLFFEGFRLAGMIRFETNKIPSEGLDIQVEVAADSWPVLRQLGDSGEYTFAAPIRFDLHIYSERDLIVVRGRFDTRVALTCSRCLEVFSTPLQHLFTIRYGREITQELHGDDAAEIELTADQIGVTYFEGEEITLDDALQEQVVVMLPYKCLCRDDCKGICQDCGADLNREACTCHGQVKDTPFAVLKNFKPKAKK